MPLWICTQHNWRSHCSCTAAHHHHQNSHLFVAVLESEHTACNLGWMLPVKLLEDYQSFIFVRFGCSCFSVHGPYENPFRKENTKWVLISSYYFSSACFVLFHLLVLLLCSLVSGVQLQFLPCLPGAHGVCWGAELPAAASRRRQQPDLARRPWPEDSTHTHRQTIAAARHRGHPGMKMSTHTNQRQCRGVFSVHVNNSEVFLLIFLFLFFRIKKASGQFSILEKQI